MADLTSSRQDVESPPAARGARVHARWSPIAWLTLVVTIALGCSLDLFTKHLAFAHVPDAPIQLDPSVTLEPALDPTPAVDPIHFLPGDILALRLALNRGAVFGLGENQRWFFILFTVAAVLAAMYVFGTRTRAQHRGAHIAIGLLLAGAIGNFYDRVMFAAVRDFIQIMPGRQLPKGVTWPGGNPEMFPWVFNVADILLFVGVIWLMAHIRIKRVRRRRRKIADQLAADTAAT